MPSPFVTIVESLAALLQAARILATPDGRAAVRAIRKAKRDLVLR